MKILAPAYFKRFRCIADKCKSSCCVDWEIDIDERTFSKYCSLGGPLGEELMSSITEDCGIRSFQLGDDGRCPFLDSDGLCRIIKECTEEYLSDICREHPRFYNELAERIEAGLGMVCEEAARLILLEPDPFTLYEVGMRDCSSEPTSFDSVSEREEVYRILRADKPFAEKLSLLGKRYLVDPDMYSFSEWIGIFSELETLSPEWGKMLKASPSGRQAPSEYDVYFERFAAYLAYRHLALCESYDHFRATVGFILVSVKLCEKLFAESESRSFDSLLEILRMYSSEIEYSEDNTAALIFEFESVI